MQATKLKEKAELQKKVNNLRCRVDAIGTGLADITADAVMVISEVVKPDA